MTTMLHDTEDPDVVGHLAREVAALGAERDALLATVRATIVAIESGAIFDWYQRDALLRRLRDHLDDKGNA
jgi:hypothetical protein